MAALMGLDRVRLGALFRLRGKLTLRQFSREPGKIVGVILVVLFTAPIVVGATIGTTIGYRSLPDHWPAELLGGVLVVLWLIWLIFPIIFSSINEGLDITRLLVYPIQRRDLVVSVLLGTLFDYPTYLMLPLLVAVFIGWGVGPVVVLAVLLSYAHMVLVSQLVSTAVGGILQSRRFRDVAIILASVLGSSCYFLQLSFERFTRNLADAVSPEQARTFSPLHYLQWLPTGAAARAIEQVTAGNWGVALIWLLYSAALLLFIAWAWWRLLLRLTTGEGFLFSLPTTAIRQAPQSSDAATTRSLSLAWLPADLEALTIKELKAVWRTPQRRAGMLQGVLMPFIMAGAFVFGTDFSFALPGWVGLGLPLYALFVFWATTQNMLGWEGRGLPALLLTPLPRQRLFLAKGIALLLVAGAPFLMISLVVIGLSREWLSVGGMLAGFSMGIVAMAVSAVASVLFPIPINVESRQMRSSLATGGGCLASLAVTFLVPAAIGVISLPAGLPLLAGYWLKRPLLSLVAWPFSLLYAVVIFWLGSRLAGNLLLEREAEVLATLRRREEAP